MGAERKSQFIEHKEKLATAYHEVGFRVLLHMHILIFQYLRADMR